MVEKMVLDYLNSKMNGCSAYMETPENIPAVYVLIEKTGSGADNRINSATITIQSISSTSLYEAACLNESVKSIMDEMPYYTDVFRAKLNSDYNYTNEKTKEYRYQAVFDVVY